jgi:hypothetical protein
MSKAGLVVLVLGLVGALLGGGTLLVSLLLPALTDGRTSWDEAMFGIVPGAQRQAPVLNRRVSGRCMSCPELTGEIHPGSSGLGRTSPALPG